MTELVMTGLVDQLSLEDGFDVGAGVAGAEDVVGEPVLESPDFAGSFDSAGFDSEEDSEADSELFGA